MTNHEKILMQWVRSPERWQRLEDMYQHGRSMKWALLIIVCGVLCFVSRQAWASDALLEAALNGERMTVQRNLQAGTDVNYQNDYNWTALMFAAFNGHTAIVQLLLDAGANVDLQNTTGKTALMWATWKGHTPVVQLLLDAGANVDLQDNHSSTRGETALMKAEIKGHTDIAQLLRAHGATQ